MMMSSVEDAVQRLNNHDVVGMPTETVYGMAARIDSEAGLKRIFAIKERPFFDPLIVHVQSVEQAKSLVEFWPPVADQLAKKFWPGPLTMVLRKNSQVSDLITSGLESVGLRWPAHPIAQELIQKVGVPLAAPSANKFGRTSPTQAQHVKDEFKGEDLLVLDGGPCQVGLESTVLLIEEASPIRLSILRKGAVLASQIAETLQGENIEFVEELNKRTSPGHMKHHYMPAVPLILATDPAVKVSELIQQVQDRLKEIPQEVEGVKVLAPSANIQKIEFLNLGKDPVIASREFYSKLRQAAERKPDLICFIRLPFHSTEPWAALMERMGKAASLTL